MTYLKSQCMGVNRALLHKQVLMLRLDSVYSTVQAVCELAAVFCDNHKLVVLPCFQMTLSVATSSTMTTSVFLEMHANSSVKCSRVLFCILHIQKQMQGFCSRCLGVRYLAFPYIRLVLECQGHLRRKSAIVRKPEGISIGLY